MNCDVARDLLSDYWDQELSPGMQDLVGKHLSDCDACTDMLVFFEKLGDLMDTDSPEFPAETGWENIALRLQHSHSCSVDPFISID